MCVAYCLDEAGSHEEMRRCTWKGSSRTGTIKIRLPQQASLSPETAQVTEEDLRLAFTSASTSCYAETSSGAVGQW